MGIIIMYVLNPSNYRINSTTKTIYEISGYIDVDWLATLMIGKAYLVYASTLGTT